MSLPPLEVVLLELLTVVLSAAILLESVLRLHRMKFDSNNLSWFGQAAWCAIVLGVILLWPNSSHATYYPKHSFMFLVALFVSLDSLGRTIAGGSKMASGLNYIKHSLIVLACLVLLISAARYLAFVRPLVSNSDFFFYVCNARDMSAGVVDHALQRYFYFPGSYTFWRLIFSLTGGGLDSLQWAYIGVIATNAVLIGAIVFRAVRNLFASLVAAVWYIVFCSMFEGLIGITSPIATLPILGGVLFWGGKSLLGGRGLLRLIALGIGLGLAVYIRQHAGFVSLGAITLLITYFIQEEERPIIDLKRLLLLPLISASVLVMAILAEGYGLEPLFRGLRSIPEYVDQYDFMQAIWKQAQRAKLVSIAGVGTLVLCVSCLIVRHKRAELLRPSWQIAAFTCIAGFASLIAIVARAAPHYFLFAGALMIISGTISVIEVIRWLPSSITGAAAFRFCIIVLALFPLVRGQFRTHFYFWPPERPAMPLKLLPWFDSPEHARDFRYMNEQVERLEKMYVLPPSLNEVHYLLETRYPDYGYYYPTPLDAALKTPGLDGVIVVRRNVLHHSIIEYADKYYQYDQAEEILRQNQYVPVVALPTMVLWRKESSLERGGL